MQCKFCCFIDRCDSWHPHTFHTLCVTSWQVLRNTRKFVVFDVIRYISCQSLDKWVSSGHSWKTDFFFMFWKFWWNALTCSATLMSWVCFIYFNTWCITVTCMFIHFPLNLNFWKHFYMYAQSFEFSSYYMFSFHMILIGNFYFFFCIFICMIINRNKHTFQHLTRISPGF